jgi:hypothetical protein
MTWVTVGKWGFRLEDVVLIETFTVNVSLWDLKSLAFQATTSSRSCSGSSPRSGVAIRARRLASRAEVFGFLNPYQSGFQPTVEPTAFQAVVDQLSHTEAGSQFP